MRSFIDDIDDHLRSVRTGGCHDGDYNRGYDDGLDYAIAVLGILTVRCKDCKWFNDFGCAIQIIDDTDKPKEDDFCSFAERREDDSK